MLEVSGIVNTGCKKHHIGVRIAVGCDNATQDIQQFQTVSVHRANEITRKKIREDSLHRLPVLQQVGNTGRTPRVVFQYEIMSLVVPDKIRSTNMDVNVLRNIESHQLRSEMDGAPNNFFRD